MTDQFDSMVDDNTPVQTKLKNYTAGNEQSRWASILTSFFESVGIETRRDAQAASNIDAVENLSKYPEQFLQILQRVVPQPFTFGQQPTAEANDQFGDLLQEMLPIRDEDRADLKRMLGRGMPEHELEMIVSNGGQLVQMIQQNFPELNIQMEGIRDVFGGARDMVKAAGRSWRGKYDKDNNPHGDKEIDYDADMSRGKQALKDTARGIGTGLKRGGGMAMDVLNKFTNELGKPHDISNRQDASGLAAFFAGGRGSRDTVTPTDMSDDDTDTTPPEQQEDQSPEQTIGRNFKDEWDTPNGEPKNIHALYQLLNDLGVSADDIDDYIQLVPQHVQNNTGTRIPNVVIDKIHAKLEQEQLSENLIMKRTFNDIVQHAGEQLLEAPEDEMAAADPAMDPAAAEAPPPPPVEEPMADAAPDDMDKLQTDMLELVRRALIINPKDIDQESYMQLTTRVSFDNMQQLKPLLLKLVQNHYPDLDMGDVPKGPGT